MSAASEKEECASNISRCISFYNIANEKINEVKDINEKNKKTNKSYYPQEDLRISVNGFSGVTVKKEIEVKEEPIMLQYVDIKPKEEIGIYVQPISCTEESYPLKLTLKHTGNKLYQCSQCEEAFSRNSDHTKHTRKHTGVKLFQCYKCINTLSQKRHLKAQSAEKPNTCSQCDKAFSQKSGLVQHLRTHTGEKPYHCSQCGNTFSQKTSLINHHKTHTGEKPYQCNQCDKAFTQNIELVRHQRKHTGEKPYQCSQCDKAFSKTNLIIHHRTHTVEKAYQCSQCDKAFSQKCNLVNHLRTHTGEKPYQCSQCDKAFSQRSDLVKHLRTHTGEKPYHCRQSNVTRPSHGMGILHDICRHTLGIKPYQCCQCDKAFSDKSNHKRHHRTHTGRERETISLKQFDKAFTNKHHLINQKRTNSWEKPKQCSQCNKTFSVTGCHI
ncbi:unnamed protein product [Meganyctiphanes norvegica]|uniref:C2H2-type domain-containing protein n=1 Tax=Meganyctiphanes norvegica TaxID=48144 RepID=A0AAV2SPH4_MEGNR